MQSYICKHMRMYLYFLIDLNIYAFTHFFLATINFLVRLSCCTSLQICHEGFTSARAYFQSISRRRGGDGGDGAGGRRRRNGSPAVNECGNEARMAGVHSSATGPRALCSPPLVVTPPPTPLSSPNPLLCSFLPSNPLSSLLFPSSSPPLVSFSLFSSSSSPPSASPCLLLFLLPILILFPLYPPSLFSFDPTHHGLLSILLLRIRRCLRLVLVYLSICRSH